MNVNIEFLMQCATYILMAIGILAFLVSSIVQVIKELPRLKQVPTSVVALVISLVLCPLAMIIVCQYFKVVIEWFYVFAAFIAAFIVYLVATGGWERVTELWNRTKYDNK